MSECVECGSDEDLVVHHTQYDPEHTVEVCRKCHAKIHNNESHPLYPVDESPYGATLRVDDDTADELHDLKERGDSYDDVIQRLLNKNAE